MKKPVLLFSLLLSITACSSNSGTAARYTMSHASDGIVLSEKFDLMWQQKESRLFSSPEEAQQYADNLTLGGYTDWRIPTKAESHNLYFSLDFGETTAKDLNMKMDRSMWVEFKDGELVPGVWDAGDTCCIVRTFKKDRRARVRAVRP